MKGTQHFSRMNYNVKRGMREIVAPSHKISKTEWASILDEFANKCAYCGNVASELNRGIVPDHLIAVTDHGELVAGNTVPACQTCNDSRGNKDWRVFLNSRFPADASIRIAKIEAHIGKYGYAPSTPELALTAEELSEYAAILNQWEQLLLRAQTLQSTVARRRADELIGRNK